MVNETKHKKIIPVGYDRCFKKIFGDNNAIRRVEAFLSEYLNIPFEDLKGKVTILNEEIRDNTKESKRKSVDIYADVDLKDKLKVNIELNFFHKNIKRNIVYVCNFVSSNIRNKEAYEKMPKILQINFDKFEIDKNNSNIVKRYYLKNEIGTLLDKSLEIDHVNIVKCYEVWYNQSIERERIEDQKIIRLGALLYATDMNNFEECLKGTKMDNDTKEDIKEAVSAFNDMEIENLFYDEEVDRKMIENDEKIIARREGLAEGRAEGRAEGAKDKSLEIAKNLLKLNMHIEDISKATGLSIEELDFINNN